MNDSDLATTCADLGHWITVAETLLAQADCVPSESTVSTPFSRPPWNQAVASALFDAHAMIRDIAAEMRDEIDRKSAQRDRLLARRWSQRAGNTGAVLAIIVASENAVDRPMQRRAQRELGKMALRIRQLPAVDEALRWERLRTAPDEMPPACPYCECYSLKVAIVAGLVACMNPACTDDDDERPTARLDISRLDGSAILVWGH